MVVVGGFTTSNPNLNVIDSSFLNDVQILNVETLEWRSPPITRAYSPPTGSHSVEIFGNEEANDLCIIGGRNHADEAVHQFSVLHIGPDVPKRKSSGERGGGKPTSGQKEKPLAKAKEQPGAPPSGPAQDTLKSSGVTSSSNNNNNNNNFADQKASTILLDKTGKAAASQGRTPTEQQQATLRHNPQQQLAATIAVKGTSASSSSSTFASQHNVARTEAATVAPVETAPKKKKGWGAPAAAAAAAATFNGKAQVGNFEVAILTH
mmetsp:Transcript_29988/g.41787  ORF Transcript_29988/g.41787 Transcript_29988/m.41787 type:complete len:264 (+) Transcript_29988:1-792(+)